MEVIVNHHQTSLSLMSSRKPKVEHNQYDSHLYDHNFHTMSNFLKYI